VLVNGRALLFVLFVVIAPGGLLAFTMISVKRWVVADREDHGGQQDHGVTEQ